MIGEPEMVEGTGGELPSDVLSDSDDGPAKANASWSGRPWVWAVGGIAVASAVWATVLHGVGSTTPDLHGYHLGGNPCAGSALGPLEDAVGKRSFAASDASVSQGPALDKVACVLSSNSPAGDGWVTDYAVTVTVELHKKTDPRAEFENVRDARASTVPGASRDGTAVLAVTGTDTTSADDVHPVAGVGDEAYFLDSRASAQTLQVLHGGAVLSLQITGYSRWNGPTGSPADPDGAPDTSDLSDLRPAMTAAMRHLMASLAS